MPLGRRHDKGTFESAESNIMVALPPCARGSLCVWGRDLSSGGDPQAAVGDQPELVIARPQALKDLASPLHQLDRVVKDGAPDAQDRADVLSSTLANFLADRWSSLARSRPQTLTF